MFPWLNQERKSHQGLGFAGGDHEELFNHSFFDSPPSPLWSDILLQWSTSWLKSIQDRKKPFVCSISKVSISPATYFTHDSWTRLKRLSSSSSSSSVLCPESCSHLDFPRFLALSAYFRETARLCLSSPLCYQSENVLQAVGCSSYTASLYLLSSL